MKYWKPGEKEGTRITSDSIRLLKPEGRVNESALVEYIKYQYYTGEETLFKGIFRERPEALANFSFEIEDGDYIQQVQRAILDSVERSIDPDTGFMVSGGLDSSLIAAMATGFFSQRTETFTGFFTDPGYNEIKYVKALCRLHPKLMPVFVPIDEYDFVDNIQKVIRELEEPCGGPGSFSQWMVYKEAARYGYRRLLSGEGGDEFFLGYSRYLDFDNYPNKVWRYNLPVYDLPIDINERPKKPESFEEIMLSEVRYDLPTLLAVDEKLPWAFGIETKAPMICDEVIALVRKIKPEVRGKLKWILREIAKNYLPDMILDRTDKMGFPTPFVKWLKQDGPVRSFFLDTMNSRAAKERGIYKADWERMIGLEMEYGRTLWGALSLELWFQGYID